MLTTLRIKNLALVADLTVELKPGFNAITGETGAGKSILIGALNLILGERADRTSIRSGSDSCSVEAVFDASTLRAPLNTFLEKKGLESCEDHQLVIKRTFTNSGTNRQFVNGSPTTLGVLSGLGEWLVDIHGPHEHQSLLHPARQLIILDAFGNLGKPREAFAELVRQRGASERRKVELIVDEKTYAQQLDLLRHQVHEIMTAKLGPDEEPQLEAEYHRASNSAKLLELTQNALNLLSESEDSVIGAAGGLGKVLHDLQRTDPSASALVAIHEQAVTVLQDLQHELTHYADRVDVDPARLRELEDRLNLVQALKRKYGTTLTEVIAFAEDARQRLQGLENRDAELARLNAELAKLDAEIWRAGKELSARRRKVIPKLTRVVVKQLNDLGFKQSSFDVAIHTEATTAGGETTQASRSLSGFDAVEFQFAPNPGESARPLRAIASSGELARVMLALKTVLAAEDEVPVLVFDEVDANIGGETANTVGEKMRQIGKQHQVLCITHLAPVAAHAAAHFVVTKQVKSGRTVSEIAEVSTNERVEELARMLGGQSEAARKHAEALLGEK